MRFRHSLENFRGLAILFVILSHFTSFHALGSVGNYVYFIVTEATSWFVFLSGYLFYHIESSRFQYAGYLAKKIKYVITPYLILSLPAIAVGLYLKQEELIGISRSAYVAWSLIVGGYVVGPMWFIPMIAIFYVVSPVFNRLARSSMIYPIAALGMVVSVFSFRPVNNLNPFFAFLSYFGFYLLGIVFAICVGKTDRIKDSGKTLFLALPAVGVFLVTLWLYQDLPRYRLGFIDGLGLFNMRQLGKLSLLIALFFLFDKYFDQKNRFLAYFAEISFGLFFIHGFFLILFARLSYLNFKLSPLMNFCAELAIVMGCSLITVYLVKRALHKRSRYVIGC